MRFVLIMMMWFFCGAPNVCMASYCAGPVYADDDVNVAFDPEEDEEEGSDLEESGEGEET